jgi:hypothetical protein
MYILQQVTKHWDETQWLDIQKGIESASELYAG